MSGTGGSAVPPHTGIRSAWRLLLENVRKDNGRLAKRVFLLTGIELVALVLMQFERGYLAKIFSVEEFGRFAYLMSIVDILAVFVLLGFDMILLRLAVQYRREGREGALNGLLVSSLVLPIAVCILLALVYAVAQFLGSPVLPGTLGLVASLLVVTAVLNITRPVMQVLGVPHLSTMPRNALVPIVSIAFISLIAAVPSIGAVDLMILARAGAGLVVVIATVACLAAWSPERPSPKHGLEFQFGEWLGQGKYLFLVTVLAVVLNWSDVVVAGNFAGGEELGAYVLVTRVASITLIGQVATNVLFGAIIAPLMQKKSYAEVQTLLSINVFFAVGILLCLTIAIMVGLPSLLGIVSKDVQFDFTLYWIVQAGTFINVACGSVSFMLLMSGHHKQVALAFVTCTVASIVLMVGLGRFFGLTGIAFAAVGGIAANNLVLARYAYRVLGLDTTILSLLRTGRAQRLVVQQDGADAS